MKRSGGLLAVLSCSVFVSIAAHAQPGPLWQSTSYKGQEIGKLTGDVYYARTDDYVSAFMVTKDGIVLVEPVGPEHAKWLKGELARRFGVPVKYVIYSHSHGDHASGAAVFADTARIIGHEALLGLCAAAGLDSAAAEPGRAGRQRQWPHRARRSASSGRGVVRFLRR
jgi:glyoxylase-like metal-dependent hydrolase (beta-lactamase superfamily II)